MILKISLALGLICGAFLIYVAMQNPNYVITRELLIKATPEKIFPHINNAKLVNAWNPFLAEDPNVKVEIAGPEEGVGSKTSWEGNNQIGTGTATVIKSVPNQRVTSDMHFIKPMEGKQVSEFLLRPAAEGTVVVWTARGQNSFAGRLICSFFSMDKMVGGTFEKGLQTLKARLEQPAQ